MAGVVGFEPTIHGTKNRCLTTWLHPNGERLSTTVACGVQGLFWTKTMSIYKKIIRSPIAIFALPLLGNWRQVY